MAESTIPSQFTGEGPDNPPAKRPCLETVAASLDPSNTPTDEGSDFYNTPLAGRTPNHPSQNMPNDENSASATPQKPHPQIPGLTFLSGDDSVSQSPLRTEIGSGRDGETLDGPSLTESHDPSKQVNDTPMQPETESNQIKPNQSLNGLEKSVEPQKDGEERSVGEHSVAMNIEPQSNNVAAELDKLPDAIPATTANELQEGRANEAGNEGGEPEWEVDSSPYESSDSSSDTSSDDSDDDDDDDESALMDPEEQAKLLMAAEGGSDDEGDGKQRGQVKTANEQPEEMVPKPDITITPEMKVEMLGNVESVVENVALIKANISGEYQVLESGSVLCLADLSVIGVVSETLGRVEQPLYTVRFPSNGAVKEAGVEKGVPIFYVFDHSSFVFTQPLKGLKGSDASNFHDEEVGEDEIEFSDDEAEAEYKRQLKQKRQQKRDGRHEPKPKKEPPGPSGLRNTQLNYDDVPMDEGYTPLARPKNLHEMMNGQEAPVEEFEPRTQYADRGFRGGRGRGRGRQRGYDGGGRSYRGRGGGFNHHNNGPRQTQGRDSPTTGYSHNQPSQQQSTHQRPSVSNGNAFDSYHHQQSLNPGTFPPMTSLPAPFPPQPFSFQQPFSFGFPPPGSHINPAFFSQIQQQQQQQPQPQSFPQAQQTQYQAGVPQQQPQPQLQPQNSAETFAAAQAQLDLLRKLSQGGS